MKEAKFVLTYDLEGSLLTPEKNLPTCFQNGNCSSLRTIFPFNQTTLKKTLNRLNNGHIYSLCSEIEGKNQTTSFVVCAKMRYS